MKDKPCDHIWKTVQERVQPERTNDKQPAFTQAGAYFIHKICEKCKEKRTIDYKVEEQL